MVKALLSSWLYKLAPGIDLVRWAAQLGPSFLYHAEFIPSAIQRFPTGLQVLA